MATGTLAPAPWFTGLDNAGLIVPGGLLYTYAAGTTTPATTYTESDLAVIHEHANPIVLDSAGRAVIYLPPASFKFILKTAAGVTLRTQDNIAAVPVTAVSLDIDGVAGETIAAGEVVYLSDGSGGTTAGRWYKTDADNTYSSTTAQSVGMAVAAIATGDTGTIRLQGRVTDLSSLTAGTVYYISAVAGELTSSAPTNARAVGQADTTTSLVLSGAITPPFATATVAGIVSIVAQTFGGAKTFAAGPIFNVQAQTFIGTDATASNTATVGGRLYSEVVAKDNVTNTETSLLTTARTLKANSLATNGQELVFTASGTGSAAANARTFKFKLGSTTLGTVVFTPGAATLAWTIEVRVMRLTSTTQRISTMFTVSQAAAASTVYTDEQAGAKDLATDLAIDFTGQATNSAEISLKKASIYAF